MSGEKIPLIAVAGPTASGKTALAVNIALEFCGEVVSADSMQIYKGMDIASAKPAESEKMGIPHHMMDFLELDAPFSVAQYTEIAKKTIFDIHKRGALPVVAGGTGLYIDSLLQNTDFGDDPENADIRRQLQSRLEAEGAQVLLNELAAIDPETAATLHVNNTGRIIRALEVFLLTGRTMSERRAKSKLKESPFAPIYIGIDFANREKLYERINRRVDLMLEAGLLEEVRQTALLHGKTSKQAIGHKELMPYIDGEISLDEAVETLKRQSRRYAKRQLTWFRRNTQINWFYPDDYSGGDEFFEHVKRFLTDRLTINK